MPTNTGKTALIVGAGPATGMAMARRFGREGYNIALGSRNVARLEGYAGELQKEGIEAGPFAVDVTDRDALRASIAAVLDTYGRIDAVYSGAGGGAAGFVPAGTLDTTVDGVDRAMGFFLYAAITIVREVVPGMLERGSGTLLFANGAGAVQPTPMLGDVSAAGAALRNYVLGLNQALSDKGIYAGSLIIRALIEGSEAADMLRADPEKWGNLELEVIQPQDIAETAWQLSVAREKAEATFGGSFSTSA